MRNISIEDTGDKITVKRTFDYDLMDIVKSSLESMEKKFKKHDILWERNYELRQTLDSDGVIRTYIDVTVTVNKPVAQWGGYKHIAVVQRADDQVYVWGMENGRDLSAYFNTSFDCNHCNIKRYRKIIHIFEDVSTGKEFKLASTCVKEYFGVDMERVVKNALWMSNLSWVDDLDKDYEPDYGGGYRFTHEPIDFDEYITLSAGVIIKERRYTNNKSMPEYGKPMPTSELVGHLSTYPFGAKSDEIMCWKRDRAEAMELGRNYIRVNDCLNWYAEMKEDGTEFTHNLKVSMGVRYPKRGMVVYATYKFMTDVIGFQKEEIKIEPNGKYYGEVGEKFETEAIVKITRGTSSRYGDGTMVKLITIDGFLMIWFASKIIDFENGQKVSLKGKVKRHTYDSYTGKNITQITNCKLEKS